MSVFIKIEVYLDFGTKLGLVAATSLNRFLISFGVVQLFIMLIFIGIEVLLNFWTSEIFELSMKKHLKGI